MRTRDRRGHGASGAAGHRAPWRARQLTLDSSGLLVGNGAAEHGMRAGTLAAVGDADHFRAARVEAGMTAEQGDAAAEMAVSFGVEQKRLPRGVAAETTGFSSVDVGDHPDARQALRGRP